MTLPPIQCTYKLAAIKSDVLRARGQRRFLRCQEEALFFFRSRKKGFYIARCKTHHPDSQDTIDTFRCRVCRLRVKGYVNTSAENLKLASLPLYCGEWLVQEVMES